MASPTPPPLPISIASFTNPVGSFQYNPLLCDGDDITSTTVPFDFAGHPPVGGNIIRRGQIMHYDAATSKAWLPVAIADANSVLAQDVLDVSVAGATVILYLSGTFKVDALIFPVGLAQAPVLDALRNYGCFTESVMNQTGQTIRTGPVFTGTLATAPPDEATAKGGPDGPRAGSPGGPGGPGGPGPGPK